MTSSLLAHARAGDEQAFRELIAPYFRELHLHCYRMLGSVVDADDVMQETMLAAWCGLGDFAGRSSLRTWLYRIATNRCLNAIRDTRRRPQPQPLPPFDPPPPSRHGDTTWLQPYPDAWLAELDDRDPGPESTTVRREEVELAFIVALQRLPPRQAAALVLVDVLGFTGAEAADLMDTSPTAVKGARQRARASLRTGVRRPAHDVQAERHLAQRFADAFVADDIDAVTRMLTDDAWLAMPPAPHEYHGPKAIATFLRASADARAGARLLLQPSGANLQPAFRCSFVDGHQAPRYAGLLVLDVRDDRISSLTRFLGPDLVPVPPDHRP